MRSYITQTHGNGPVHLRTDPRVPITACGESFEGRYATTSPAITGAALTCPTCRGHFDQPDEA